MAPLVGYDSSDEEEDVQQQPEAAESTQEKEQVDDGTPSVQGGQQMIVDEPQQNPQSETQPKVSTPTPPPPPPPTASIGPSLPPPEDEGQSQAYPEEMDQDPTQQQDQDPSQPPASPYTANRSLIHNLTLPTVPNLDIPPSPPTSPSSATAQAALTARIDKFLELKRKKGTHFNAKIADSHALKNPPLMDKLLGFVGVGIDFQEGPAVATEQYATTLSTELWDPAAFPEWAYRGQLRKSQERMQKEKGRDKGEAVQFVPASS